MPWKPLPQIAFAVAIFPFVAQEPADLPLELGDELYIIEQGGYNDQWLRGYLLAPPSLLAGLTSSKDQTLEARVFSGIFPRSCVEVREILGYDDTNDLGLNSANLVSEDTENGGHDTADGKFHHILKRESSIKLSDRTWTKSQRLTNGKSFCEYIISRLDAAKPQAPVPMLKVGDEIPTSTDEPLVDEIASCLREWHSTYLHRILLAGDYQRLGTIAVLVKSLDAARKQLLYGVLTKHELVILRQKVVWEMVQGNKLLGGDVIVRDPAEQGRILGGDDSIFNIAKLQIMMSLLEEQPCLGAQDNSALFHLLVDLKIIASTCTQNLRYIFLLASKVPGQAVTILSESYVLSVAQNGSPSTLSRMELARTLFADLSSADIGDSTALDNELFLIVKRQNLQQIDESGQSSRTTSRDGKPIRTPPQTIGPAGKSGRRSFMWGNKPHKNIIFRPPSSARVVRETFSRQSRGQESSLISSHSNGSNTNEKNSDIQNIYRNVAIGALKLNDILKQNEEVDQMIHMWTSGPASQDDRVYDLEEVIERSNNPKKTHKSELLRLHLKPFSSSDSNKLIKTTNTLLSGIVATKKIGFSNSSSKTKSDIFLVIKEAFLPPQVFLTRATGGASPLSQSMTGLNLQLSLEVRNSSGEPLTGCIYPYSNSEAQSTWVSAVIKRGEPWRQTLRLVIPTNEVPTSHLVLKLTDLPNAPFAISYMPLWDQKVFLPDGDHSLLLYTYDETTNRYEGNIEYLSYPWFAKSRDDVSTDEAVTGPIANLRVQTYLGSSQLLQDKVLASLLKWKELPDVQVQKLLKRLLFVPDVEIVKLLDDVLDALFEILVEKTGDEYGDLTFNALVTVLGIIHDRRFNMGVLVDQYTKDRFYYPFATPCLLRSFTRLLAKPSDPDTSQKLRATFKVLKYVLKFITRSSNQQKEKEAEIGITSSSPLPRHLKSIFKAFYRMMQCEDAILVGSKTLAVQHFHTWLPELTSLLSKEDIINIAIDFMDSCASVKGRLILYKMVLIINYSQMELFSGMEDKRVLCINTVRWIAPYWGKTDQADGQWRDQIRLCCSIVSCQAEDLTYETSDYISKVVESYAYILTTPKIAQTETMRLSFLFPKTYPFPSKQISTSVNFDEALIELSTVLSAMSMLPDGIKLEHPTDELAKLLEDTLNVYLSILNYEAYPEIWLSLHIYHHKAILVALDSISRILQLSFLPDPDNAENYNTDLWQIYFTVLFKLVGSCELALETFPEQKRRVVWKIAGDVRGAGAELMRASWEIIGWESSSEERERYGLHKLGGYQVQYVPCLVGPIVELCLSVHQDLRKVAVEILQTMIVSEWILSEDISIIQTEMIDCLDQIFKTKPLTESILQKLFIDELKDLFSHVSNIPDDPLYTAVHGLLITVSEFLDLLMAVYGSDVTSEAANITNRLRLMEFLRDIQKEEILIRYIHQLAHLQSEAGNSAGAGLSLRLHADLYDWDSIRIVPALSDPNFPTQTHFERKECLYFEMIKFFEEGEAWSCAISAYEELQMQYQNNVFNFPKLSRTLKAIGSIYETIAKSDKLVPRYFRVVYRGLGFPPSLRDKQFVYEGYPNETQAIFQDRIQAFHPAAQITTTNDNFNLEGQFLQIFVLSPYRDLNHPVLQRTKVPQTVRDYLMFSFPQTFSITQKCNTSGPITEHTVEKTLYKTVDRFPTLLRYTEIESVCRQSMSVLETAVERVIRKTAEISNVVKRLLNGDIEIAPLLIEVLQTSVDPSSDSTVSRYRSLLPGDFLNEDNELQAPELTTLENALKTALIDYALTIRRCLTVFSQPGTKSLISDVERDSLIQGFESTFAPELMTHAFLQPSDIRDSKAITWSLLWPYSPPTSALSSSRTKVPRITNVRSSFGAGNSDPSTRNSQRKRQSIFQRRQERREKSNGDFDSTLNSSTVKADESSDIKSKRVKNVAAPLIRNRGTSGSVSSQKTQSTRHSISKDHYISIHERDMSRRMRFIRSGTLSRVSHRKEHSELRSQSELGHRSSTKQRQNFRDTIHGESQFMAKGGFGRVTGGVKNTFNLVGLGLGRKKSISEHIVAEES
ncbi:hypothetical protein K3495_g4293 [Podosphaera aphanis]|nr:hypothetical protein K3495_g4293 [Podosphaera aphanis]